MVISVFEGSARLGLRYSNHSTISRSIKVSAGVADESEVVVSVGITTASLDGVVGVAIWGVDEGDYFL
jgi:hypothetical protein